MTQQRLFNTAKKPKNRSYIDRGASIPITICIFTKNRLYVDSGASIPTSTCKFTIFDHSKDVIVKAYEELKYSCSHYFGNDQLFNFDVESPSLSAKDTELFYHHFVRLLFISKSARLDIQACVAYTFTRMKLPLDYYKDRHMNMDLLLVNKTHICLMLYLNDIFMYFKTLLSKHDKYIQIKLKQIIQS